MSTHACIYQTNKCVSPPLPLKVIAAGHNLFEWSILAHVAEMNNLGALETEYDRLCRRLCSATIFIMFVVTICMASIVIFAAPRVTSIPRTLTFGFPALKIIHPPTVYTRSFCGASVCTTVWDCVGYKFAYHVHWTAI